MSFVRSSVRTPGARASVHQQELLGLGHAVCCAPHVVGDEPYAIYLAYELMIGEPGCMKARVEAYNRVCGNVGCGLEVPDDETDKYGSIDPGARDGALVEVKGLVEKPKQGSAPSNIMIPGRYILQQIGRAHV